MYYDDLYETIIRNDNYTILDYIDDFDNTIVKEMIVNEFAEEYMVNLSSAEYIINSLALFEILVERYWDKIYKKLEENKNEKKWFKIRKRIEN